MIKCPVRSGWMGKYLAFLPGLGCSKLSLVNPGVSLKVDFGSESFKRKYSSNLFACNLITGCSNESRENCL